MFDWFSRDYQLLPHERDRLRTTLRIAALFHDLGHAPLSHTTEGFMPSVASLELDPWVAVGTDRRATHEDYTLKILTDSDLTELIRRRFRDRGIEPEDIAALIAGRWPPGRPNRFVIGGRNWLPILRQVVSSELDADRMDYLLRDSYFAGVPYGRYDLDWLIENVVAIELGPDLHLGLYARASSGLKTISCPVTTCS
ncbi:MAG: HD domain-containing protein [Myxococcales bacterium]|nr:HD domain-containing protein [Myxococcales bacterium]